MKKVALNLRSPFSRSLLGISAVLFFVNCGLAVTYTVTNAADFNALPSLNAGDIVRMQSGTYGSLNKNIISTIASDDVAISNPIKIYAVDPGGVIVNAPSYLLFTGRGIIFAGVDFTSGCGKLSNYGDIVRADDGSKYITFSQLRFTGCGSMSPSGEDVHWIRLGGFNNTIEYCSFNDRPESSSNVTVWVIPDISEGGIDVPRNHRIHHCYFGTRYAGNVNGYESIRIGVGAVQTFDMRVTVEGNVFYRSIWRTDGSTAGEPEIISIKSKGNKIFNNTILESQGGICFRSGTGSTVEGNFIIGGGYYSGNSILTRVASTRQGGIRVIGKNQVVRNNYIFNVIGTDIRAALCVMSGESNYYEGDPVKGIANSGSYQPADYAQIYNNTFINCAQMNLGFLSNDSYGAPASPTGVKIYNNAWQGNGVASSAVVRDTTSTPGYTPIVLGGSGGNYIYETVSGKYGWNGLVGTYSASSTPAITEILENYKIPTSTSVLLGAADATLCATTDIRGFTRPSTARDIGCYERDATGTTPYAPMLRNQVGPVFDEGPASSLLWIPPVITSSPTASAYCGNAFSYFITAANEATSFNAPDLPTGLSLNPNTGEISGIPTVVAGTYNVTVTATNSYGSTSATLNIQVSEPLYTPGSVYTYPSSTNWTCPSDVANVQIECWGAGGAGGSASRTGATNTVQYGGGGAGGAYAKKLIYPVVPGNTYYINVGTCASNTNSVTGVSVSGGDSWFNSVNSTNSLPVLAKGGAGGNSAVGTNPATAYALGGLGTTNGSIGNVLYAGGSGANGSQTNVFGTGGAGGGGSGAGSGANGTTATTCFGATNPTGFGSGGTGAISNSLSGTMGFAPGGGGGGSRNSSGLVTAGAAGGNGQVILTTLRMKANLTLGGLAQTYDGNPKSVIVTTDPANLNTVVTYNGSSNLPTAGGSYAVEATINENSYSGSVSGTLVIAKISQAITFGLDPATGKVGYTARTLIAESSSGLPVTFTSLNTNVATITGGNTLNFIGIGTTTITAKQAGNSSYEAATDVGVELTVTASDGLTFGQAFGGLKATNMDTDGLAYLMKYALGGTNTNDKVSLPTVSMNGSNLTLTAVVRTNDTNLTIIGQSTTNLAAAWTTISPNSNGVVSTNINNVPEGCQRRDFSVNGGTNSRTFLRLKATQP